MQEASSTVHTTEQFLATESRAAAAKRIVAGLHPELALAANGKVIRPDRLDHWDGCRAEARDPLR